MENIDYAAVEARILAHMSADIDVAIQQACVDAVAGGTGVLKLHADGTISNVSSADTGLTAERLQELMQQVDMARQQDKRDALGLMFSASPDFEEVAYPGPMPSWFNFWPMRVVYGAGIIGMDFGDGESLTSAPHPDTLRRINYLYGRSHAHTRKILREWRERGLL